MNYDLLWFLYVCFQVFDKRRQFCIFQNICIKEMKLARLQNLEFRKFFSMCQEGRKAIAPIELQSEPHISYFDSFAFFYKISLNLYFQGINEISNLGTRFNQ